MRVSSRGVGAPIGHNRPRPLADGSEQSNAGVTGFDENSIRGRVQSFLYTNGSNGVLTAGRGGAFVNPTTGCCDFVGVTYTSNMAGGGGSTAHGFGFMS